MPKFRTFDSLYKELNVKQIQETSTITESEKPSNQCKIADHKVCDFIFKGFVDGKGRLMWKGHIYRFDDEQLKQLREMLLKDLEGEDNDEIQ